MVDLTKQLITFGVSIGVLVAIAMFVWFIHMRLLAFYGSKPGNQSYRQLIMVAVAIIAVILAVLIMPIGDAMRGQLLSFLGILLSATIALSSTTLVGNAVAGLMIKALRNVHIGDYLRVNGFFGRVSNMDLLHVELQGEDRDLTTLPNLYLVTHPITVIRDSGTILHVQVSLGYDIPRSKVEKALMCAAEKAGLEKPFIEIRELGDFSITYQISGLLTDISKLISTRRDLRAHTLDCLHNEEIEIVSPNFMVTRSAGSGAVLPKQTQAEASAPEEANHNPDEIVFDKALRAEERDALKTEYTEMSQRLLEIESELKGVEAGDDKARRPLTLEKKKLEAAMRRAEKKITKIEEELGKDKE